MKFNAETVLPGTPIPHTIGILLETILKNNLSFMDKHFLQLVGTAMGTKAVSPYANLFIGRHQETICEVFIWAFLFWKTFIDDIFMIFLGTTNQLPSLQDFMNHSHRTIKFTFQHSTQQIFWLDMNIHIRVDRKLSTTLYRKPTNCAAPLHFHSNHLLKCKENITFHKLSDHRTTIRTGMICKKIPL